MTDPILKSGRATMELEAAAILFAAAELGGSFVQAVGLLHQAQGRIVCTGMGKSGHIARKVAATLSSTGAPALFVHAGEAGHGDLGVLQAGDVVLAFSKSGATVELAPILGFARVYGIPVVAITAGADSPLVATANVAIIIPDVGEVGPVPAPTTSTAIQLAVGDALAIALAQHRRLNLADFHAFHPGGALGAALAGG